MTTDTPDSVRALVKSVKDSLRMGYDLKLPIMTALTRYAESLERTCEWQQPIQGRFATQCGREIVIEYASELVGFVACPYCVARIVEVRR